VTVPPSRVMTTKNAKMRKRMSTNKIKPIGNATKRKMIPIKRSANVKHRIKLKKAVTNKMKQI